MGGGDSGQSPLEAGRPRPEGTLVTSDRLASGSERRTRGNIKFLKSEKDVFFQLWEIVGLLYATKLLDFIPIIHLGTLST